MHKWRQKVGIEKDSYLTMEKWQVLERGHIYFDRTSHSDFTPIRVDNFYVSVRNKRRTTVAHTGSPQVKQALGPTQLS